MWRWVIVATIGMSACGRVNFDVRDDGSTGGDDANTGPGIVDVALGNAHTCALASTGQLKCWGNNPWGILGIESAATGPHPSPATIPTISLGASATISSITSFADYTCALLATHDVKCWGNNDGAQLGQGDFDNRGDEPGEMGDALAPVALSAGPPIDQIVTGHYHTCIRRGGNVACWGNNDNDQNGYAAARTSSMQLANLENVNLGTGFVAAEIHALFNATCAIDPMERVKCWGANNGNLGLGDLSARGDSLADMGDNLPFVNVGAPTRTMSTGFGLVCVITDVGLKCWGDGANGALGGGDVEDRGDEVSDMGANLPVVDLGGTVEQVASGGRSSCAILTGGSVKCWGENQRGQLGIGDTGDRGDAPNEMGANLPAVPLPAPASRIFVGGEHACAILTTGELACWGGNGEGQLGTGDTMNLGDQPGESPVIHSLASLFP